MMLRRRFADVTGLAVLLLSTAACERVVSVRVPSEAARLVVEARLESPRTGAAEVPRVRLTTTQAYFDAQRPPAATGAVVVLRDNAGGTVPLAETSAGEYTGPAQIIVPGRVYTLEITWGGDRYVAVDTAADVAALDSLYFALPPAGFPGRRTGLRATIDFRDPGGTTNHYLWDQWINGTRVLGADSLTFSRAVITDVGLDGRAIEGFAPYAGVVVAPGATVRLRQRGLSPTAFDYFVALNEQLSNDGSPFALPSTSVRNTIRNLTSPSRRASGYFSAGRYDERTAVLTQ